MNHTIRAFFRNHISNPSAIRGKDRIAMLCCCRNIVCNTSSEQQPLRRGVLFW
jgi:hypothetical protein